MPVFTATQQIPVSCDNFDDVLVLQVNLGEFGIDTGRFIVLGRVVITNFDGDAQNASARLSTLNGNTELDRANVRIESDGIAVSISLQGTLDLADIRRTNNIVDIRCSTFLGDARAGSLFLLEVDQIIG